jgi:hypothetical protein
MSSADIDRKMPGADGTEIRACPLSEASGSDLAGHAINFLSPVGDALGFVEHAVFGENLVVAALRRSEAFSPKTS